MNPLPGKGLLLLIFCTLSQPLSAQEWTQWRGDNRDGRVTDFRPPKAWPEAPTRLWSVDVGAGLATPLVSSGRIYLLSRRGDDEIVSCHRLEDGEIIWQASYAAPFYANGTANLPRFYPESKGKGPFATPILHRGRLYVLGVDRVLSCFNVEDGELLWRNAYLKAELPEQLAYVCPPCGCSEDGKRFEEAGRCSFCGMAFNPDGLETSARSGGGNYYGASGSPLVAGDLGIIHIGNTAKGEMIAFDLETGKARWTWESPVVAYASPVLAEWHGQRQIVTMTRFSVAGVALEGGELLWDFPLDSDSYITTPAIFDDKIIVSLYRGALFALKVSKAGSKWSVEKAWENPTQTMWMSSPVVADDQLYGFFYSKRGQFARLNPNTGKLVWASEGRQGARELALHRRSRHRIKG